MSRETKENIENSEVKENVLHDDSIKEKEPARWFYISDSSVKEYSEVATLKQEAFLLFYQLREE